MKNPSFWEDICFRIDECNLNVRADQIRSRLNFFPIMVGSQMIIEPLLVGLLWGQVAHANLIIWLTILIVIHAVEMTAWWKQRMLVETIAQCRTWSVRFVVFAVAVGAMWGGRRYVFSLLIWRIRPCLFA